MTGRDDSALWSGTNSSTTPRRDRTVISEEKAEKRVQLLPAGQIVYDTIQAEIDAISRIDFINIEEMMSEDHFKAEMMARKKTVERLRAVQSKLSNILREKHEPRAQRPSRPDED